MLMAVINDVSVPARFVAPPTNRTSPLVRGAVDVALVLMCVVVLWALASRSLLLTALPLTVGIAAAATAALRFGAEPRRAVAGAMSAAALVTSVLLTSPRIWSPEPAIAAACVLTAAVGLAISTPTSTVRPRLLVALVAAAAFLLGPGWALWDADAAISATTALRLLAAATAAACIATSRGTRRSVVAHAGLIVLALAGASRIDLRSLELLAGAAVGLLILDRWWRDLNWTTSGPPDPRRVAASRSRSDMTVTLLLGCGAWGAALAGSWNAALIQAAGALVLVLFTCSAWPASSWELARRADSLERIAANIARTSQLDRLTNLPNREAFERRLGEEIQRALRHQQPVALCFVDIDHFKTVNDTYGHGVGDEVLVAVADVLRSAVRTIDVVARYGGEEFVVIAPGTWSSDAVVLADRLRQQVSALRPTPVRWPVTISVGVASLPEHAADAAALVGRADQALYESKRAGRDRTTVARADDVTDRG